MSRRTWWALGEVALAVAVLIAALTTFARARAKADGDEAEWIGTSRYFQTLFVERDLSAEAWADSYWTRTQPMMARYVIGAWLWARGYDLTGLNPAYHHNLSWATNQRAGRAPPNAVLDEARMPMRILAALAVLALYLIVRLAAGPIGGLVAALLVIGSPYLTEHLVRAKGDTTLMSMWLLGLLAAVVSFWWVGPARPPSLGWGLVAGAFLGLALGSKLTAVLGLVAIGLWGAWAAIASRIASSRAVILREAKDPGPPVTEGPGSFASCRMTGRRPAMTAWRSSVVAWTALVLGTAIVVFVASNPFLYRDPIGRTRLLFQNRQEEMAGQASAEPHRAVYGLQDRIAQVWDRSLFHETWGMSYLGWPVEPVLAVLGVGWLVARAVSRRPGLDALLLLWAACVFGGVSWGLGYRLQHYFVPTALVGALLAGLGAGWTIEAGWRLVRRQVPANGIADKLSHVFARRPSPPTPSPEFGRGGPGG